MGSVDRFFVDVGRLGLLGKPAVDSMKGLTVDIPRKTEVMRDIVFSTFPVPLERFSSIPWGDNAASFTWVSSFYQCRKGA